MRKLVVSMNVTLDGFLAGPNGELNWHFPLWNGEMAGCAETQLRTMDTILVGRITYETMAAYWPRAPRGDFANMMNGYTKIVFSKTLKKVEWVNSVLMSENIEAEVSALKAQAGKGIIIYGSASIVRTLMKLGLIDEYRIWMHPVFIGKGKTLFKELHQNITLQLIRTKRFGSGVMLLYYVPLTIKKHYQRNGNLIHTLNTHDE